MGNSPVRMGISIQLLNFKCLSISSTPGFVGRATIPSSVCHANVERLLPFQIDCKLPRWVHGGIEEDVAPGTSVS
jgi:hypothetical protein